MILSVNFAASYNLTQSNNTNQFQNIIDTDKDSNLVITLDNGDNYEFGQININRNVTIIGKNKNKVKITGNGSGTLFNITTSNVKIINLTIVDYDTAIKTNTGYLTLIDNNITTNKISVDIRGNDLREIQFEGNIITSYESESALLASNSPQWGTIYITSSRNQAPNKYIDILFKNNTIIAKNRNAINIGANSYTYNNITFLDNIIIAERYGVLTDLDNSNSTNYTMINNNITTGVMAVDGFITSSNNTKIFIDRNNMSGNNYSFLMSTASSNEVNVTITNNKLWSDEWYSLALYPSNSKNTSITVIGNSITGNYSAINLDGSGSTVNITFRENNITAKRLGALLDYDRTNNSNILFEENNIIADIRGITTSTIERNNNSSITIRKNNITSTYGLYIFIYNNSNTPVIIEENKLIGGIGAYMVSYENTNNLYFLKNNISADYGLYFYLRDSNLSSIISGNTISANGVGITLRDARSSNVSVIANYNRIIGPIGLNFTNITNDFGSNFDYNWWGINDIENKIVNFTTNNHYILGIFNTSNLDNVKVGDKLLFNLLVLNTTLNDEGIENLPHFVINGTFNGETYESIYPFSHKVVISEKGLQALNAFLDEENATLEFNSYEKNFPGNTSEIPNNNTTDDKKDNPDDPIIPNYENTNTNNNTSNNYNHSNVKMESTGIPIMAILLMLIVSIGITYRKR